MASSTMNRWLRPEVRSDPPLIFSLQFTVRSDLSISLYFLFDFCVFIDLMWTWMCVCRFIRSSQPWGLLWGSADSSWFATSASTLMSGLSPSPFRSVLGRVLCMFACNQRLLCDSDWLHHFFWWIKELGFFFLFFSHLIVLMVVWVFVYGNKCLRFWVTLRFG